LGCGRRRGCCRRHPRASDEDADGKFLKDRKSKVDMALCTPHEHFFHRYYRRRRGGGSYSSQMSTSRLMRVERCSMRRMCLRSLIVEELFPIDKVELQAERPERLFTSKHHNHSSTLHYPRSSSLPVLDYRPHIVDFVRYVNFVLFSTDRALYTFSHHTKRPRFSTESQSASHKTPSTKTTVHIPRVAVLTTSET